MQNCFRHLSPLAFMTLQPKLATQILGKGYFLLRQSWLELGKGIFVKSYHEWDVGHDWSKTRNESGGKC